MKKKLLFSPFARQWNSLLAKFYRLHRKINSSIFLERYSVDQQKGLLAKLQSLFRRLEKLQYRVGIKLAGTAVALIFASSVSFGQAIYKDMGFLPLTGTKSNANTAGKIWAVPTFADIDKDGDLDLIIGHRDGDLRVCLNDGNGVFAEGYQLLDNTGTVITGQKQSSPAFADVEKDGKLELYMGLGPVRDPVNKSSMRIYRQESDGFTLVGNLKADGDTVKSPRYLSPAFADIDKDGNLDMFCGAYAQDGAIFLYKNDGAGNFSAKGRVNDANGVQIMAGFTAGFAYAYSYNAFSDIDGDGDLDLVVGGGTGSGKLPVLTEYVNNNGQFTMVGNLRLEDGTVINADGYNAPAFADVDGDGIDELFTGWYWGTTADATAEAKIKMYKLVDAAVGLKERGEKSSINIYPNPATDVINIKGMQNGATVKIYNLVGGLVAEFAASSSTLNITSLPKGVYAVMVNDGKKQYTRNFVKK